MSKAISILETNWTAYPNELIRNYNSFMTRNEQALMIFLWDKLYGYEYQKNDLSYSVILNDCTLIGKNRKTLNETIQGLERKGLLKVFRQFETINKYYIGERQIQTIKWYGKVFRGWKDGAGIELPPELIDGGATETNEGQEKTLYDELMEAEIEAEKIRKGMRNTYTIPVETLPLEKRKLETLTDEEFIELFPDMDTMCLGTWGNKTIEQFKIQAEQFRARKRAKAETQIKNESETETVIDEPIDSIEDLLQY
ncbi:hypothetical protein AGMMS50255_2730 [Spirochaetia bacterium]|nr:hypothetical protein AGMMS50255_2730 [Spirochaetia bacterium]